MTATSRFTAVVDALVTAVTAAVNDPTVPVFDGPMLTEPEALTYFTIGSDGSDGEVRAGRFTQTWAGLGNRARDEFTDIDCALVVLGGDEGPFSGVRDTAFNLLAAVEANLRTNAAPGIPGVLWQEITDGDVFQANTNRGPRVRIPFTVHARSRI